MAKLGFIGLGNMGAPMARNLVAAGHDVAGFDMGEAARREGAQAGVRIVDDVASAASGAAAIVLALPAAPQVRAVVLGDAAAAGVAATAPDGALIIDCSTIDPASARDVARGATERAATYLDSPMSGGVGGATAGTLTFMVGGSADAFAQAQPILAAMGQNIFHAGDVGAGCAAKLCNNMLLAISMIGVSEAFNLAEKLGLDAQKLYDISSTATGRCWSLNDYCPAPGPVPNSPANRDYAPGFAAALMLKDLRLAMAAAQAGGATTPLGAQATQLYAMMAASGGAERDFSGVIKFLRGEGLAP